MLPAEESQAIELFMPPTDNHSTRMIVLETLLTATARAWHIDLTMMCCLTIHFGEDTWEVSKFSDLRLAYLEGVSTEELYQISIND